MKLAINMKVHFLIFMMNFILTCTRVRNKSFLISVKPVENIYIYIVSMKGRRKKYLTDVNVHRRIKGNKRNQ